MENKNEKKVLFSVKNLKKYFPLKKKPFERTQRYVRANESITLDIYEGETLGLVGESGCGKSTFGRTIIQLYEQTGGSTLYYGRTLADFAPKYAAKVIKAIPSLFPKYLKEKQEFEKLSAEFEAAEDKKAIELEEKAINKRRDIEEKYFNMLRIAGGLLVHNDLKKVSDTLLEEYNEKVVGANIRRDIEKVTLQIHDDHLANKKADNERKLQELNNKLDQQVQEIESKRLNTQKLRDEISSKEGYDFYEEMKDTGIDLSELTTNEMRELRKEMQMIFQDPYSSLDTKMTVGNIIGEGVLAHKMFKSNKSKEYQDHIIKVMEQCGLADYFIHRYPHQFSGGQRQRIGIARALALQPKFIVADEAVSALDVSIQSQVINLLQDLKEENNLTYLFITHDLSVVKYISDRVGVMYLGNLVELTQSDKLFEKPLHPYTQALLAAIPRTDVEHNTELSILEGDIPSAVNPPKGCKFHTRCKYAMDVCSQFEPAWNEQEKDHFVACHLYAMEPEEREQYMKEVDERVLEEQKASGKAFENLEEVVSE
ncbi:MAG: ATP-binding cassette domain-containing protein [Tissierellia bacterium]|nr:ATP-binding cassette domain-containing protein [Tissierellia bacterium]